MRRRRPIPPMPLARPTLHERAARLGDGAELTEAGVTVRRDGRIFKLHAAWLARPVGCPLEVVEEMHRRVVLDGEQAAVRERQAVALALIASGDLDAAKRTMAGVADARRVA